MGDVDRAALIGRARECEAIASLLARAKAGESGSLVIRGEPGAGKTALLGFGVANADGMKVLRVSGTEGESDLAFAGVFGLLRPALDSLERVAEPQARALASALGVAPGAIEDRFLVSAGVLGVLAADAEDQPLLCVVDDAQWLDRPSAEALVFASRRLGADAVVMLFASADVEGRSFETPGVSELLVEGLDRASAAKLLDARAADLAAGVRERVLVEAAGNPLALLELPAGLSEAQRLGLKPLPDQIPLTPRLRGIFQRRIERLPQATRSALLVCAAGGTGELTTVLGAAAGLGLSVDTLAPAEEAGLLDTSGGTIAFRHPLVRSAVIDAAPLAERQRVHSALASELSGEEQADRRVWHLAMAALTGDEEVAAALENSARRAQERGGYASAATAFQRAAELTRDKNRLAPRLAAAAEAAWNAGQPDRARGFLERASRLAESSLDARLLHLQGLIEIGEGRYRDSVRTLIDAAAGTDDLSVKLAILVDALEPRDVSDLPEEFAVELASQAEALPAGTGSDRLNRLILLWHGRQHARRFDEARAIFAEIAELTGSVEDDARVQYWSGVIASFVEDFGAGLPFLERAVALTRSQGRIGRLPSMLPFLSNELYWEGQYDRAYAIAGEGYRLALDMRLPPTWHLMMLARVEAIWGRAEDAYAHIEEAELAAGQDRVPTGLTALIGGVKGLLELGLGRPDRAADALLEVAPGERLNALAVWTVPDLVEAVVRADRPRDQVEYPLHRLRTSTGRLTENRGALTARCDALLGNRSPDEGYAEAIARGHGLSLFEQARTELLFGEWLRRERRRGEARPHLRAAAETFRRVGAAGWQDRAEAELRASGETARKREPTTSGQLTSQEFQIARLAAEGRTNPEIAAQLYLSPRTIEYHLRKVFAKLGIAGRTELILQDVFAVGDAVAP